MIGAVERSSRRGVIPGTGQAAVILAIIATGLTTTEALEAALTGLHERVLLDSPLRLLVDSLRKMQ
jgi:hypothetical protein